MPSSQTDLAQALSTITTPDISPEAPAEVLAELADAGALIKVFFLTSPSPGLIAATERELVQVMGFAPIFITTRLAYHEITSIKLIEMQNDAMAGVVGVREGHEVPIGMPIDETQRVAARELLAYVVEASGVSLNG